MRVFLIILIVFLVGCQNQPHENALQIIDPYYAGDTVNSDSLIFIDVDSMMKNIQQKGKTSIFFRSDLIKNILYLDKSSLKTFLTIEPNFIKEKGLDTSDIFRSTDPKVIQEYPVNIKNLKDYFINEINWKATVRIFKAEPLDSSAYLYNRIYIWNNTKAIFTIIDDYVSGTFRATLKENRIILEPIFLGIE
jgi:hypothetical protein